MNKNPKKPKATQAQTPPGEDTQTQPVTSFTVIFTRPALGDLAAVSDLRTRQTIYDRAKELDHEPLGQGKPLREDLKTYHSVRAAGQRYRVVYQVAVSEGIVTVVVIGIRREGHKSDVYKRASKRLG